MDYIIIGTAGHIDHGKTVLVRSLTGIDTDRLEMEKKRGISIELGFAPLKLPSGRMAGIIDVPGHEKFIRNMLAGVGGIDIVILVVAADEGIMPQTGEHLDIINLLNIKRGIVVITKTDLADEELIELVKEDVAERLEGTSLEGAPVIEVSALKGGGIDELLTVLDGMANETGGKSAAGKARLPVDRSFSMPGFGTVVTGTLWSGVISVGDILMIESKGMEARVRGLQVHGKKSDKAFAGQRTAVNLASVELEDVPRGSVLLEKNYLKPARIVDARLRLVDSLEKPLKNRARVKVYLGTSEKLARVSILEKEELLPGEESFVQLLMEEPLVAAKGDRFVIRSYSPMHTIGGGEVVEANARKLKRFSSKTLKTLETKLEGSPEELIEEHLLSTKKAVTIKEMASAVSLSQEEVIKGCEKLLQENRVIKFTVENEENYMAEDVFREMVKNLSERLKEYHARYYLRPGISKEELRSRYYGNWNTRQFNDLLDLLVEREKIKLNRGYVAGKDFVPEPALKEKEILDSLAGDYKKWELKPPTWSEVVSKLNISAEKAEEYKLYLQYNGELVKITQEILFHKKSVEEAKKKLDTHLSENGSITVSEARDLLQSSRKYALPLLEHFDSTGFTRRVGDKRIKPK